MSSQQQSVEQLFGVALDLEPSERRAFLDRACGHTPEIKRLVEELLLEEERAGSFLRRPIFTSLGSSSSSVRNSDTRDFAYEKRGSISPRFEPGQVISNRFTVIRFIDRGGMGEVYEVEDRFLQGAHVALKMILPEIAADAASTHRFEQEVILARKVTHPNLCPIYEIFHCPEPPPAFLFLTMKLLSGETLGARLMSFRLLPRDEALEIFRQMISGIAAIHEAGVIHRDIKPNNVMLDHSGLRLSLSIMDFGLARLHETESTLLRPGMIAGTPGYIAPELLNGHQPSQASDIFALGVLLHQVLTGDRPVVSPDGLSAHASPSLSAASVPALYIKAVQEFLSDDPQRRCRAFSQIQATLTTHSSTHSLPAPSPRLWTRRNFAITSAASLIAVAGGAVWKRDRIYDAFHPLPSKRFVAILGWPPTADARVKPMLLGLIDAMANELSRAEAFDHNLFVASQRSPTDMTTTAQLNDARESLGANLVLATSAIPLAESVHVVLQVLGPSSFQALRSKTLRIPLKEQISLPAKVIEAAAELLEVDRYRPEDERTRPGTDNTEALAAFQTAEALMKKDNDTGLEEAIDKYKQAIEIDPHFALAQARLSWSYLRSYGMHRNPAALALARANCESAISIDPDSVEAHLGLAWVLERVGDRAAASRELAKALSLDPSNPHTLNYQGRFYADNGEWREAEDTFSRLTKMRPNYWLAHNELGIVLDSQGKYNQALAEFRSASFAAPKNALAIANVAATLLQMGKLSEAGAAFQKSLDLRPNDAAAIGLAAVSRISGKYSDAVRFAEEAVKLEASMAGNWLELGDCYVLQLQRKGEAASAYKRAAKVQEEQLRNESRNGSGAMLLALCLAKTGESTLSPALIKKAESDGADDIESQLVKARVFALLDMRDDALNTIRRCRSRGATVFQFKTMPDLQFIRDDPRYRALMLSDSVEVNSPVAS